MSRLAPSTRWTSFEGWDYNSMKERLESLIGKLDKNALMRHAQLITGKRFKISEAFSAGQFWVCFEMIAEDSSLIIARVRLPLHPDYLQTVSEKDEQYSTQCEIATMGFVRQKLPSVPLPRVYAYEGPGSQLAADAGATYMLIEGFYGNTLQDVVPNLCSLPVVKQEYVMAQWTKVQVALATLTFPLIGSISRVMENGEPIIDKVACAASEGMVPTGPFSEAVDYFRALGHGSLSRASSHEDGVDKNQAHFHKLGASVFLDIVQSTTLFQAQSAQYPLQHMDLGTQNILVDDELNFLAVIDWELAQTAPWQVNYYPFPFPLLWTDEKTAAVLADPSHLAHKNTLQQTSSRQLYKAKFREAEAKLRIGGDNSGVGIANVLDSATARIFTYFSRLGIFPEEDKGQVREMVRLAFGYDSKKVDQYLEEMSHRME